MSDIICVGCGSSFVSNISKKEFCSAKCYQKHYQKKYYELNGDRLRQYGRDYFQKKQVLLKSAKLSTPSLVCNVVRVRIIAPQLSTHLKTGTVIAWKTRGWEGRGVRVLLDGYKTISTYHPDFISYIVEEKNGS